MAPNPLLLLTSHIDLNHDDHDELSRIQVMEQLGLLHGGGSGDTGHESKLDELPELKHDEAITPLGLGGSE